MRISSVSLLGAVASSGSASAVGNAAAAGASALEDVALHPVHGATEPLEVPDGPVELGLLSVHLEDQPPGVPLHVGAPDVRNDVELLDDLVDERPVHELLGKRHEQSEAAHRSGIPTRANASAGSSSRPETNG